MSCDEFTVMNDYFLEKFLMIYGYVDGYTEPSAEQEMDWTIHNDHAGDADQDDLDADELDSEQRKRIAERIAQLNDQSRKNPTGWFMTQGVLALSRTELEEVVKKVVEFSDFTPGNNPYGERDFDRVEHKGEGYYWKIDYYDLDGKHGSLNPADPAVTKRVLTLMTCSEY
jgi:hypothetical protein